MSDQLGVDVELAQNQLRNLGGKLVGVGGLLSGLEIKKGASSW